MKELMEYLRKQRNGQRIKSGILLAKKLRNSKGKKRVLIGWSKCKLRVDKFDREIGLQIAKGRIKAAKKTKLPPSIKDQVKAFTKRCKVYFKTEKVKVV